MQYFTGGTPLLMSGVRHSRDLVLREAEEALLDAGAVETGDLVAFTICESGGHGHPGGTNSLKLVKIGAVPTLSTTKEGE